MDVELIDVGRRLTTNLAVEDVVAEQTNLRDGKPVIITARVFNAGIFPGSNIKARLSLEGIAAIEHTVTLAGHTRQLVRFEVPVTEPGHYRGFVEVAGNDDLPFDDRRWLAFEARRPDRVLLVDGEPGPSVYGNQTYYLETACGSSCLATSRRRRRLLTSQHASRRAARGVPCPRFESVPRRRDL